MIKKIKIFGILLFVSPALQASLLVKVTNIHDVKGRVMVGIYSNQDDLQKRNGCTECRGYKEKISGNAVTLEINDLAPGWYMIAVYHDVNDNEKLDTNFLGIPVEPYGFSLNRMGMFGPSFEKSKFYYDGNSMNIDIKLK